MLHDVVIVGAGPVGSTLALAVAAGDVDVAILDGRPAGQTPRGDRSLALSHGARLILERTGVWDALAAVSGALTPIVRIDIVDTAASARIDTNDISGFSFTDFFNLLKVEGKWTVVNKIYHTHATG